MINDINNKLQEVDIPATVISVEKVPFGGYRYIYTFETELTIVKEYLMDNNLYGVTYKKYSDVDDPNGAIKDITHDIFKHWIMGCEG